MVKRIQPQISAAYVNNSASVQDRQRRDSSHAPINTSILLVQLQHALLLIVTAPRGSVMSLTLDATLPCECCPGLTAQ